MGQVSAARVCPMVLSGSAVRGRCNRTAGSGTSVDLNRPARYRSRAHGASAIQPIHQRKWNTFRKQLTVPRRTSLHIQLRREIPTGTPRAGCAHLDLQFSGQPRSRLVQNFICFARGHGRSTAAIRPIRSSGATVGRAPSREIPWSARREITIQPGANTSRRRAHVLARRTAPALPARDCAAATGVVRLREHRHALQHPAEQLVRGGDQWTARLDE